MICAKKTFSMLPKNISDKTCIFVNFLKNMNFDFFWTFAKNIIKSILEMHQRIDYCDDVFLNQIFRISDPTKNIEDLRKICCFIHIICIF